MKRTRTYSRYTVEAAELLGARIRLARRRRRWSVRELADRVGVTPFTLDKVERGDPSVGLGIAFEAAALVGVALFHDDRERLSMDIDRTHAHDALLPRRVPPRRTVKDDF